MWHLRRVFFFFLLLRISGLMGGNWRHYCTTLPKKKKSFLIHSPFYHWGPHQTHQGPHQGPPWPTSKAKDFRFCGFWSWDTVSNNPGWPQTLCLAEADPELLILLPSWSLLGWTPGLHGGGSSSTHWALSSAPPVLFFSKLYFAHSLWCCAAHVGVLAICEII